MSKPHVGVHLSARDVPALTDRYQLTACQIFTVVPQMLKIVKYDEVALRRAAEAGLHIWIHSSYLVSPWGAKPYNVPFCIKQLRQQVAIAARGVIFHIPKVPASMLAARLKHLVLNKPPGSRIVLENNAVRPDMLSTYETPEKINALIDTFIHAGIPRRDIWLCFDTAHLYCSGVSFRTRVATEAWFARLKYPDRIACFHVNGNASRTYSDVHTIPFGTHDLIWGGATPVKWRESGAAVIHEFCQREKVDIILECDFTAERRAALALVRQLQT